MDFEKSFIELQDISQRIQEEDLTLSEAQQLYNKGMEISNSLKTYINEIKTEVTVAKY